MFVAFDFVERVNVQKSNHHYFCSCSFVWSQDSLIDWNLMLNRHHPEKSLDNTLKGILDKTSAAEIFIPIESLGAKNWLTQPCFQAEASSK